MKVYGKRLPRFTISCQLTYEFNLQRVIDIPNIYMRASIVILYKVFTSDLKISQIGVYCVILRYDFIRLIPETATMQGIYYLTKLVWLRLKVTKKSNNYEKFVHVNRRTWKAQKNAKKV